MPRHPKSGYERLNQDDLSDSDSETDYGQTSEGIFGGGGPQRHFVPIQGQAHDSYFPDSASGTPRPLRRVRSNSSAVEINIKALNARLERWAEEIANKFKRGKKDKSAQEQPLEIQYSVFKLPEGLTNFPNDGAISSASSLNAKFTKEQFDEVIDSVKRAILKGTQPKMITQGSSGSYFARNENGDVVGIMKPKNEEPYGKLNPKWTKWLHRNLFPCFFGRACLIPNLSYISEAAACLLDRQLQTFIVPYTDVVWLSSSAFHYDYWDRRAHYRKGKPLPEKVGSFQIFLKGFKDANIFLRENPWPDRYTSFQTDDRMRRNRSSWTSCRTSENPSDDEDEERSVSPDPHEEQRQRFVWTAVLQQSFREELEKLVILDYIMRNTDRGLDNWMIKIDIDQQRVVIATEPPRLDLNPMPMSPRIYAQVDGQRSSRMISPSRLYSPGSLNERAALSLGAIDNSLAFPWKHPDQWRSFPFGWLFLPVSLIGQPFSQKTRNHFLPLLTSSAWWQETQTLMRKLFSQDSDFEERMFARQMAVLKGQAFNVVETLKSPDQGPLELTRRTRMHVWDDVVEVPVAVPMRMPSLDVRQQRQDEMSQVEEEEMDISAALSPTPSTQTPAAANKDEPIFPLFISGPTSPRREIPSGRLSVSRSSSNANTVSSAPKENGTIGGVSEEPEETDLGATPSSVSVAQPARLGSRTAQTTPGARRQPASHKHNLSESAPARRSKIPPAIRARMSFDGPSRSGRRGSTPLQEVPRRRGYSLTLGTGAVRPDYYMDDYDDDEGDLGYSVAADREGNRRKVIIERLETVKTRHPFFTWC